MKLQCKSWWIFGEIPRQKGGVWFQCLGCVRGGWFGVSLKMSDFSTAWGLPGQPASTHRHAQTGLNTLGSPPVMENRLSFPTSLHRIGVPCFQKMDHQQEWDWSRASRSRERGHGDLKTISITGVDAEKQQISHQPCQWTQKGLECGGDSTAPDCHGNSSSL